MSKTIPSFHGRVQQRLLATSLKGHQTERGCCSNRSRMCWHSITLYILLATQSKKGSSNVNGLTSSRLQYSSVIKPWSKRGKQVIDSYSNISMRPCPLHTCKICITLQHPCIHESSTLSKDTENEGVASPLGEASDNAEPLVPGRREDMRNGWVCLGLSAPAGHIISCCILVVRLRTIARTCWWSLCHECCTGTSGSI